MARPTHFRRPKWLLPRCLAALAIVAGMLPAAAALADEALLNRFLTEYPAAARRAKNCYQGLSVKLRESNAYQGNPTPDLVYEHEFRTARRKALLITRAVVRTKDMDEWPVSTALVAHPRLSFAVEQRKDQADWSIKEVGEFLEVERGMGVEAPGVAAPYAINGGEIAGMVRDQRFSATGAEWVEHEGQRMARISYQWDQTSVGWLLLHPDEDWIMYGYLLHGVKGPEGAYQHATITYQPSGERLPWLKQARYWIEVKRRVDDKLAVELAHDNIFDVVEIARQDVPEHEFTLAAFGLPEPGETPRQPRTLRSRAARTAARADVGLDQSTPGRRHATELPANPEP
jgi:hypothetical protein